MNTENLEPQQENTTPIILTSNPSDFQIKKKRLKTSPCDQTHKSREITVLFTWEVNERLKRYFDQNLKDLPHITLLFPSPISDEVIFDNAKEANIIVGWRRKKILELLFAAEQLALYINPGAGVQHLIEPFREINLSRKVLLTNSHGNSYFTAQHAVALLLALSNKIIPHHNWMIAGRWRTGDEDAISTPLRYRKIGLLGYGAVNQKVHRFLSGFDVDFSILRRNWEKQYNVLPTPANKYTVDDLAEFLTEIDTLIVAIPETTLTTELIKMEELHLLGLEGLLVNIARGQIIHEASLFTALKEHIIAGAAIDVWWEYTPLPDKKGRKYPFSQPFHTLDNVILSPHRAASPINDLSRWDDIIENIRRFVQEEKELLNVVNIEEEY